MLEPILPAKESIANWKVTHNLYPTDQFRGFNGSLWSHLTRYAGSRHVRPFSKSLEAVPRAPLLNHIRTIVPSDNIALLAPSPYAQEM